MNDFSDLAQSIPIADVKNQIEISGSHEIVMLFLIINNYFFILVQELIVIRRGRVVDDHDFFAKMAQVTRFVLFFRKELTVASVQVAWQVLRPRLDIHPGIVAVPLDARGSDASVARGRSGCQRARDR